VGYYRKKPVVIEARKFTPTFGSRDKIARWSGARVNHATGELFIKTLEGEMKAFWGDYIIKGVKGEFYPCRPDIFEATYEEVEANHG
jgi:hypothetical protein